MAAYTAAMGDRARRLLSWVEPIRDLRQRWRVVVGQMVGVQGDLQLLWTPQLPLIYVPNPKAGTCTINNSLKAAQADAYARAGGDYVRKTDPHLSDDCLRREGLLPSNCSGRFLFSCVRNPFTRALSGYLDKVVAPDARLYLDFHNRTIRNFEDYLQVLKDCNPRRLNSHFRAQHYNLDYPNLAYDAIFYLEHSAAIGRYLSQIYANFKIETFAPHSRAAAERLGAHYNSRSLRLVRDLYARDFALFGYSEALEDADKAPGQMLADGMIAPWDTEFSRSPPQKSLPSPTLKRTLRFRRLVDNHLI